MWGNKLRTLTLCTLFSNSVTEQIGVCFFLTKLSLVEQSSQVLIMMLRKSRPAKVEQMLQAFLDYLHFLVCKCLQGYLKSLSPLYWNKVTVWVSALVWSQHFLLIDNTVFTWRQEPHRFQPNTAVLFTVLSDTSHVSFFFVSDCTWLQS